MKRIYVQNGIVFFYGNPAGYLGDGKAVIDCMFQKEELVSFVKEAICHLFAIANDDKYDFDTENGNHLYAGFLDAYDEYRTQLLMKKERGKLDKIIRTEKREQRGRKDE